MTRAARDAQRPGAAALRLIFTRPRGYLAHPRDYFRSSSFFAPTPARWLPQKLGLWSGYAEPPGSLVLHGHGGRTAKPLILLGSTVLFQSLTRDARAGAPAHTYRETYRTTEPQNFALEPAEICQKRGSMAVLRCTAARTGHGSIRILAGYCLRAVVSTACPDLGLFAEGARRNFRASVRLADGEASPIALAGRTGENGGNPPFFEGAERRVGTVVLECSPEMAVSCGFAGVRQKPARLAAGHLAGGASAAPAGHPPTPPSRASSISCTLPLTFFRNSIDLDHRGVDRRGVDRNGRLAGLPETGSGARSFPRPATAKAGRAGCFNAQAWVGDGGVPLAARQRREDTGLWLGARHVNG